MKRYRIIGLVLAVLMLVSACSTTNDIGEVTTEAIVETTTQVETSRQAQEDEDLLDREAILSQVYTIPKNNPYSTGYKTIGFEMNPLINSDFRREQAPWQINSLDGVVIDKGLTVSGQEAEIQHVILTQGLTGFEKMKTYQVTLQAIVVGEVPIRVSLRSLEDNRLLAQVVFETDQLTTAYQADFPLNDDLPDGAIFEVDIETDQEDLFTLKDITLVRKPLEMVWNDEFEVEGLPDSEKWGYDVGGSGWGNGERQYYTAGDLDNAFVKDGKLHVVAIPEELPTNPYTSARLVTRETYDTKFKRVEVRAKLPDGVGTWPAIWMMPSSRLYGPWPASGEIDIMEHVGYDPDIIHGTVHTTTYNHTKNTQKYGLLHVPDSREVFHTYTIDWTPYEIDFYVDDYLYFTYDNDGSGPASWPYDKNFYLILNLAIGGSWGGQQGIDESALPATMEIDYVRYYELPVESVDLQAPEAVKEIDVEVTGKLATYRWASSTDDYLVDRYEVYLDDLLVGETEETTFTLYQLKESTNYSAGIVAVDESGNKSTLFTSGFVTSAANPLSITGPIQGEDALISVGGQIKEGNDHTYVEYLDEGDYLVFEVDIPESGTYSLGVAISSLMSKGALSLAVDGVVISNSIALPSNGSWDTFKEVDLGQVALNEGSHYITLLTEKSGFTVDYITIE